MEQNCSVKLLYLNAKHCVLDHLPSIAMTAIIQSFLVSFLMVFSISNFLFFFYVFSVNLEKKNVLAILRSIKMAVLGLEKLTGNFNPYFSK